MDPRGITERIRRKLYLYFKNTTSTFRVSGFYRATARAVAKKERLLCWREHEESAIFLCCFHAPDVKISRRSINQVHVYTSLTLDSSSLSYVCMSKRRGRDTCSSKKGASAYRDRRRERETRLHRRCSRISHACIFSVLCMF